ncbi:DUF5110 domain-containing protein [candidate division KSB1 bacterium]|nr:DUF5110 domain-containing protein [candidate division KSB1 bacterium]
MKLLNFLIISLFPVLCHGQVVKDFKQLPDRIEVTLSDGTLGICPLTENTVRVKFFKDVEVPVPELVFTSRVPIPDFRISDLPSKLVLKMKNIMVVLDKQSGNLTFADKNGSVFLSEMADSRKIIPDSVMGEPCFMAEQAFESPAGEHIMGLGQFQDGHFNLKNVTRRLTQVNSQIALPFIYSSKGYGLLWHQYGLTDFNPADNFIHLIQKVQTDENDKLVEVTTTAGTQKVTQNQSLYTGAFSVPEAGEYSVFLDLGGMGNRQYVLIDGEPCIDQTNLWLPPTAGVLVELTAGEHQVQVVCKADNTPRLSWKRTGDETTFRSPHSKMLDYVVFYGPSADSVIATYRDISGNAPMLPRWAYGFWQCRERYTSATHLVETVKEFRKRKLPMDVIVQDWQYWGSRGWGVPQFDETNYPNPTGFIKEIHDLNAHFNISIWSNPDKNSEIGKEFVAKKRFIPGTKWLDYFNPATRKEYWHTLKTDMFDHGVDSWWMDAVEPENDALTGETTYMGAGDFYRLVYPLLVSQAVYEGQRETTADKRVCILTRSAFLGQQRYSVINWSGDIGGNWDAYRRQIFAGLNYSMTGLPYWTTDIGGFFRPGKAQYTDANYRELLIRWFQWGAFNPIFRVHGYQSETEPWKYGRQVEENMRNTLNLRYRLLPYIYSEAWQITTNGSTMLRPLIMDFRDDSKAVAQSFEYMFGKSILVAPVTEFGVREQKVYLPKSSNWFDFWTGEQFEGGQTVKTAAPLDQIPLFVQAGSILPIGSVMQYSTEKNDPLEIRIYPGADGEFTLYEDENDNYNYEKGLFATIKFKWNDSQKTLTIDERNGSFPGMLAEHTLNIVMISGKSGLDMEPIKTYDTTIRYNGKKVELELNSKIPGSRKN